MSLTYRGVSAPRYSTGTPAFADVPTEILDGDIAIMVFGQKPTVANTGNIDINDFGWTQYSNTGGGGYGGTLGADTGNTNLFVGQMLRDSSDAGAQFSFDATNNNVNWGLMFAYGVGGGYDIAVANATDNAAGNVSLVFGTDPGVKAGDHIIVAMCIPTDVQTPTQFSGYAISMAGVTFSAITEVIEPDSTSGNDIGGFVIRATVTAGASSGVPTVTATVAGTNTNVRGPGVFIRIRELGPVGVVAQTLPKLSQSVSATAVVPNTVASVLPKATQSVVAKERLKGTVAGVLPKLAQSAATKERLKATVASVLAKLTQSASTRAFFGGTAATILPKTRQAAVSGITLPGHVASVLPKLQQAASSTYRLMAQMDAMEAPDSFSGVLRATNFVALSAEEAPDTVSAAITVPIKPITALLQRAAPGAYVVLYELDLSIHGGGIARFTPQVAKVSNPSEIVPVRFGGEEYIPIPILAKGFERSAKGQPARPTLEISNVTNLITQLMRDNRGVVRAKLKRIRTLARYLDDGATPDTGQIMPIEQYVVSRLAEQSKFRVIFELRAAIDIEGVAVPKRCLLRGCGARYRIRVGNDFSYDTTDMACPYDGDVYFNAKNEIVSDPKQDLCSFTSVGCKQRFGENSPLPMMGFEIADRAR